MTEYLFRSEGWHTHGIADFAHKEKVTSSKEASIHVGVVKGSWPRVSMIAARVVSRIRPLYIHVRTPLKRDAFRYKERCVGALIGYCRVSKDLAQQLKV